MIDHIAIVGLGSIGRRHLRLVRKLLPKAKVVVVRTNNSNRIEEEKFADKIVYSLEEAIESGIQAAIISSPATYHINQLNNLIEAGIHVLVEKPLSNSLENLDKLFDVNRHHYTVILVGYCLRYDPAALKFREILLSNIIGEILHVNIDCGSYLPEWRPDQDYRHSVSAQAALGGGVLLELSHELDYSQWFFGKIEHVFAKLRNSGTLDVDVEDSAELFLESSMGFTICVHLDFNSKNTRRKCVVRGTKGDLTWDAVSNILILITEDEPIREMKFDHDRNYIYIEQLKHFINCIENKQLPKVSLDDGIKTLRLIEAARISSEEEHWVTVG